MNCKDCNNPLEDGASFCGNCGLAIEGIAPVSSAPTVAVAAVVTSIDAAGQPTLNVQPAKLAPDNPLYVPIDASWQAPSQHIKNAQPAVTKVRSLKWPAITGMVLSALYLLGSAIVYTEQMQDYPEAYIVAAASIDILLGLLIFIPSTLLLISKNKKLQISFLQVLYISSLVISTLSVLSFRPAGILFLIPGLLARQVRASLKSTS